MIRQRPRLAPNLVPTFAAAAASLALACATAAPAPTTEPPPPAAAAAEPLPVSDGDRGMAALSFIAYTGEKVVGADDEVARELAPCFAAELARQPLAAGWELVWGPAVFRFEHAQYSDNLMYVVRGRDQPSRLAVVVRGTNGPAVLDWLVEDFSVFRLEPWPYGDPPAALRPQISAGTRKGLEILQGMVPPEGVPGAGQGLQAFLGATVAGESHATYAVSVTGHSLGGALAPALALWLADTAGSWDPQGRASLDVVSFAGPTGGDADYAAYYDLRLGGATRRVHNPLDVVPHAWDVEEMRVAATLFEPLIALPHDERIAFDLLIDAVERKDFQHELAAAPPLAYRQLEPSLTAFGAQVGWQHHCGYLCGLGIRDTLLPVSDDCSKPAADPCPVCP